MDRLLEQASDEELLRKVRRTPAAFGVFYRRYEERMLRFFLSRVGNAEVAADLMAETFAAALSGAHRFRARKGPASARQRLGTPPLLLTDELLDRIEAFDQAATDLVEELPDDQRQAVRARVIDERDYAQIAKDLRCSEAVVRKRVSRGLATLRDRLGET